MAFVEGQGAVLSCERASRKSKQSLHDAKREKYCLPNLVGRISRLTLNICKTLATIARLQNEVPQNKMIISLYALIRSLHCL